LFLCFFLRFGAKTKTNKKREEEKTQSLIRSLRPERLLIRFNSDFVGNGISKETRKQEREGRTTKETRRNKQGGEQRNKGGERGATRQQQQHGKQQQHTTNKRIVEGGAGAGARAGVRRHFGRAAKESC
jgi:hypothetical protein